MSRTSRVVCVCIAMLAFSITLLGATARADAKLTYVTVGPAILAANTQSTTTAPCPTDAHVLGGGQYILSAFGGANLTASNPFDGVDRRKAPDDGWKSTVRNFTANNLVTVFAICGPKQPAYEKRTTSAGPDRIASTARVGCPSGTRVTGGGVKLPVSYDDSGWLESSAPFDGNDANSKPDDGWTATGGVEEREVDMKTTAICGTSKLKYAQDQGSAPTMNFGEAAATCPGDSHVLGGGMTSQGVAFHPMTISSPFDSGDPNGRPDNGWQGEFDNYSNSDSGLITAYAICRA